MKTTLLNLNFIFWLSFIYHKVFLAFCLAETTILNIKLLWHETWESQTELLCSISFLPSLEWLYLHSCWLELFIFSEVRGWQKKYGGLISFRTLCSQNWTLLFFAGIKQFIVGLVIKISSSEESSEVYFFSLFVKYLDELYDYFNFGFPLCLILKFQGTRWWGVSLQHYPLKSIWNCFKQTNSFPKFLGEESLYFNDVFLF